CHSASSNRFCSSDWSSCRRVASAARDNRCTARRETCSSCSNPVPCSGRHSLDRDRIRSHSSCCGSSRPSHPNHPHPPNHPNRGRVLPHAVVDEPLTVTWLTPKPGIRMNIILTEVEPDTVICEPPVVV